jgi:alkylation response protein AidB-like acyl-CoA dehydrogenase
MDFGFTQEQQEVQTLARQILADRVSAESLAVYDEYQAERFDPDLWRQLAEAGLTGVAIGEQYGGMGFGFTELALFIEEVGRSIAPVPAIMHCVAAALPIQQFGSEVMRAAFLPAAASGEMLLTAALTEALNENPANPCNTRARVDGDDLLLSGSKFAVPFAHQAQRILLAARTAQGVAVVLLDPQSRGVTLTPLESTTFEPQYQLDMESVRVPAAEILCASGGEAVMQWISERTSTALCAHQLGATDFALRLAASYTSEREQFGVPVATFQAVGHRMADCYIDVECLRLCTYQAMSLLDSASSATTEVQIAKIWAGDTGHRVSYATQHVHGGTGIDRDYPLWRYCLWMRHNEMSLGSSSMHTAQLGARLAAGQAQFS